MSCLEEEQVLAFVEGDLAAQEREEVQSHLAECDSCRHWLARAAEALLSTGVAAESDAVDSEIARRPREGEKVGRYRVKELLGAGAMGVVVAAHDTELDRSVALKWLRRDASGEAKKRFLREARLAGAVAHPGIVAIHDVLTTGDGQSVLVMDHLKGETLREYLKRKGQLSAAATAHLMGPVLDALAAAHARGIVHRDLKPENIFLARGDGTEPRPRLLDFGVAKLMDRTNSSGELTETGTVIGTPHYMAPEQAFGEKGVDQRADLWAVGVMLYECLSGTRPIVAASVGQVLKRLALRDFEPLSRRRPDLHREVTRLVDALLLPRDERGLTALEVRDGLAEWGGLQGKQSSRRAWLLAGTAVAIALGGVVWLSRASGEPERRYDRTTTAARGAGRSTQLAVSVAPEQPAPGVVSRAAIPRPAPPVHAAPEPKPDATPPGVGPGKLLTKPPF